MGVWYQLKNANQGKVALQAIYTIVDGLSGDFYNQVSHKMLNVTTANYNAFLNAVTPKLTHLNSGVLASMYYDKNIGFQT